MKTKILSGLLCCLGIFSVNAQTITAPTGQSLIITNAVDITVAGGTINVPNDGAFNVGGFPFLRTKTSGSSVLVGLNAGNNTMTGIQNVFLGSNSGNSNTTGVNNSFFGFNSGKSNTSGNQNMFIGTNAGISNTSGSNNSFVGFYSGQGNTTGHENVFLGTYSGYTTSTGELNSFFGHYAGVVNTIGSQNVFMGGASGRLSTTGNNNSFIGTNSGYSNTTGSNNTYIGYFAQGTAELTNATGIGANATATASNTVVLGNAATTITGSGLADGNSGLKFANLKAGNAPTPASAVDKVLSVDATGNVILVALSGATTTSVNRPVAESTWKNQDGYLYNNSTNGVVINGTGLDGNALIVKGGVLSKEVNVKVEGAESWPDYVFKPTYKRMSLEEVEKFISINGHLPNVASATEMAATGNNLNKTDIKLLEKVEELTLYLLDMKKANDAQSAEIQALKKQMSKLRKK